MRRWAATLLMAAASAASLAVTAGERVEPEQVAPSAWYVRGASGPASLDNRGFNSNAGFVVTDEGVVVIDALGTPGLGEALLAAIRSVTDQPIRILILTHWHADHAYGAGAFRRAGAEIWVHEGAHDYLDGEAGQARLAERKRNLGELVPQDMELLRPDRWLTGDLEFELGGEQFILRHLGPAHTPEDTVILARNAGVLFAGDIIMRGRIPLVGQAPIMDWLEAIDRLLAYHPKVLVPGHGAATPDPAADLAMTSEYLRFLAREVGCAGRDFLPFDEVYAGVDWSRFESLPGFAEANRANAWGAYLQGEAGVRLPDCDP
jgi:glyoxylase-like metal-dependent hydrolase (beta-lactamase superfamily II)